MPCRALVRASYPRRGIRHTTVNRTPDVTTDRHASVTVDAAAELVNVDSATIRRWSASGTVEIEWRGDMEVVRLDQVEAANAMSRRERSSSQRGELRSRLEGATIDELSVAGLQQLARDREGRPNR
jgi:hypothetical protein